MLKLAEDLKFEMLAPTQDCCETLLMLTKSDRCWFTKVYLWQYSNG